MRRFVPAGLLTMAASVILALAAASLGAARPVSAGLQPQWNVDTHRLVRELAVLRRPQRAGDLNAALLRDENIRVRWVGALMRRVRVAGRDVYLVPAERTSSVIGSGLAVFSPSGTTCCVSAKILAEGGAFVDFGAPLWLLGVVPDGVARVTITAHGRTFTARVSDNTVDLRSRLVNVRQEMTWYGPHGAVVRRLPALPYQARGQATTITCKARPVVSSRRRGQAGRAAAGLQGRPAAIVTTPRPPW